MASESDPSRKTPTHVRHHVSSIRFGSVARDRVEVSSYFAVHTDVGLDHWGRYRDVLVPVDGRWLFAHRRISVDGFAAGSLMTDELLGESMRTVDDFGAGRPLRARRSAR